MINLLKQCLYLYISATFVAGCITPPQKATPSFISVKELTLVSKVKKGQDYARAGKLELAEVELRQALLLAPMAASIYNDVGFVLQGQRRFVEAEKFYLKSITLDSKSLQPKLNLARLYYETHHFNKSLESYLGLLVDEDFYSDEVVSETNDLTNELEVEEETEPEEAQSELISVQNTLSGAVLSGVYRNIAQIYYKIGFIDEALCYSRMAYLNGGMSVFQLGQHIRMLMSVDKTSIALELLKNSLATFKSTPPTNLFVDYGILLFNEGEKVLASQAFTRVLSLNSAYDHRRTARLFRLYLMQSEEKEEEADFIFETLLEDEPSLCKNIEADRIGYWPIGLAEQIEEVLEIKCGNQKQSIF